MRKEKYLIGSDGATDYSHLKKKMKLGPQFVRSTIINFRYRLNYKAKTVKTLEDKRTSCSPWHRNTIQTQEKCGH